jgi:hypothetical protein
MSDTIDRFDPRTQLPPVLTVRPKSTFFRDTFMQGGDEYFPTENVEWDSVLEGAPAARFVGEDMTVEATERTPYKTNEIKTPIMQERRIISAKDISKRSAGENVYTAMTPEQRAIKYIAEDVKFCLESIDMRIEIMTAQFMTTGLIDISYTGRNDIRINQTLDYQLPNKTVLTGADRWGQTGVDILASMREQVDALGHLGYTVEEVIMSPEVWAVMYQDPVIQKLLDIRRYEFGNFKPEMVSKYGAARPVGMLSDPYVMLYTQNAEFGGKSNRQRFLPVGCVLFVTRESKQNKLGYGSVTLMGEDEKFRTMSGRYIQEFFRERRPAREEVLVTSRAVPIPFNTESWAIMQVL